MKECQIEKGEREVFYKHNNTIVTMVNYVKLNSDFITWKK